MIDLEDNEFNEFVTCHGRHMCESLGILNKDNKIIYNILNKIIDEFMFIGTVENIDECLYELNNIINNTLKLSGNIKVLKNNVNANKNIKDLDALKNKILPFCDLDYILYNKVGKYKIYNKHI
jgi:hypothetical protein